MKKEKVFIPAWMEESPPANSYRSIFKWGAPGEFKHPNKRLFTYMKEIFGLGDEFFLEKKETGLEKVDFKKTSGLKKNQTDALSKIVGEANIHTDPYNRLRAAYGKTMIDLMRLRKKQLENLPDAVLYPRDKKDIKKIIEYCNTQKIPVYIFGGRSSVTRGTESVKGGVSLDMSVHMNRVLEINETNQTVTVEPGIFGPALEDMLNNARKERNASRNYTCGHFPQSFEFSTVGGWIAALGSGQGSTYYGDMKDLVVCQEYVTPIGEFVTKDYPAAAIGPNMNDIVSGAEGILGVMVSATIKIFRYMPENRRGFSFIFPDFDVAIAAVREISQGEFGLPSVLRLSDPEETDIALKLYGVEGTILDKYISLRGYKAGNRCLVIGHTEGEKGLSCHVKKMIRKIGKKYRGLYTTSYVVKKWEEGRYRDPYMREDLQDYGIIIDTLETSVKWDNLKEVHEKVRSVVKSRPQTVCMVHGSHFYPQGTNLYFIFIGKMDSISEYKNFHKKIIDAIDKSGGSLSHHHGVGKMLAPWYRKNMGEIQFGAIKAIKNYFDPKGIMNPGGTFGLDEEKSKK